MIQLQQVMKFVLEGLAVALSSRMIARTKLDVKEIAMLGLTAAAVFMVLEFFAPSIVLGARQGAGFGLGANLVGGGYLKEDEDEDHEYVPEVDSTDAPYKLVDGMYSHKTLLAGYNQDAEASNNGVDEFSRYPWDGEANGEGVSDDL